MADEAKAKGVANAAIPDLKKEDIFDIFFDTDKKNWNPWKGLTDFKIAKELQFHEVFIPTTDSIRHSYIL